MSADAKAVRCHIRGEGDIVVWLNTELNTATAIPDDYVPSDAVVEKAAAALDPAAWRVPKIQEDTTVIMARQRIARDEAVACIAAALAAIKREGEG